MNKQQANYLKQETAWKQLLQDLEKGTNARTEEEMVIIEDNYIDAEEDLMEWMFEAVKREGTMTDEEIGYLKKYGHTQQEKLTKLAMDLNPET